MINKNKNIFKNVDKSSQENQVLIEELTFFMLKDSIIK